MIFNFNQTARAICICFLSCVSPEMNTQPTNVLPATALKPFGRYFIDKDQNIEMVSSAVHFGFSFEGKECQVFASMPDSNGHNYLQYELDGVYQKRVRINGNSKEPIVITAPNGGPHTVWVYKATEAHTGPILVQKIIAENSKTLQRPAAPLIEFIGNSITCGAAADPSEVPCGTGEYHDQHNA
jgi:hypothetical protein